MLRGCYNGLECVWGGLGLGRKAEEREDFSQKEISMGYRRHFRQSEQTLAKEWGGEKQTPSQGTWLSEVLDTMGENDQACCLASVMSTHCVHANQPALDALVCMKIQGPSVRGCYCQCGSHRNFLCGTAYKDGYQVVTTGKDISYGQIKPCYEE